ncbi:oxygenase MpaB family protein [Caulobacter segnis]|uniref:oxygenase MpaB family protein n=1 Tax=Caulobacter segnis TaxID=88688 RepID=UPI00241010AC|nr:oxygenase MpaB family protein [Caulobacter segnis]MDG2520204.1 oxygenase MpaB family protein [Caulobacter segnis]
MIRSIEEVRARVAAQKTLLPAFYGQVDFDHTPERFTEDASLAVATDRIPMGVAVTRDDLDRVRAYTMLGDQVADAYAALIPQYGFRRLIAMLTQACEQGAEAVQDAPPELAAFIADMEATPDWVDMDLVREGARLDRNATAHLAPFAIRGAFMATFLNKYSALPMALTGTLSNDTAAKRVNETATFFTTTVLPGALERHGEGFKAAAMVRLMHSMVRINALRSGQWDSRVYGVPIPQVDQMPAGLIPIFLMAFALIRKGRTTFTRDERAKVELARYRCFLLGLPEDLLADTPEGIVRIMTARNSTLRRGFDDATCGALIRATLDAYLPPDRSPANRLHDRIERRFAKAFFLRHFMEGDRVRARELGIEVTRLDEAVFVACALLVYGRMAAFRMAGQVPVLRDLTDAVLVRRVRGLLARYGHAEYTTDASKYRSAAATPAPAV